MSLRLYNSLTRRKEPFQPIDPDNVRMYVCGPTVYDFAHIGNARPIVVFDVLFRLLRHHYGPEHVSYARNITDVDDKINARAAEEYPELPLNAAIRKVTEATARQFEEDIRAIDMPQQAEQHIEDDHRPRIADVGEVVDRRPAHVHAHVAGIDRLKRLLAPRQRVVQPERHALPPRRGVLPCRPAGQRRDPQPCG